MIEIHRATLETCAQATGTVVVIDVLRAFTTAAFVFDAGAAAITVVSEVEKAFELRDKHPDWLIMGEEGGPPVEGFDFDNSPAAFVGRDLTGRRLIQRTSSGTQGLVRSRGARHLLASSLCCAQATADHVSHLGSEKVTMVITGSHAGVPGDEDQACADYLEGLLYGASLDRGAIVQRVRMSRAAQKFKASGRPEFSPLDLEYAVDIDRFGLAMVVESEGAQRVMRPVYPGAGGGRPSA